MSLGPPRLRMFAGPDGSGKTTIKNGLGRPDVWFGIYINPDDLEKSVRETGAVAVGSFSLSIETEELRNYFAGSSLLQSQGLHAAASAIEYRAGFIDFPGLVMNSYYASVLADFLRRKALAASRSFSFETVMSAPDKVELLREAQERGFRTYLYYVATDDPEINISRIKQRVSEGGHDVPVDKVVSRYHRSLQLLPEAIRFANRAFFFDTSEDAPRYFAEIVDGESLEPKSVDVPKWFLTIWEQF